jgi:HK97 family phage portal protein
MRNAQAVTRLQRLADGFKAVFRRVAGLDLRTANLANWTLPGLAFAPLPPSAQTYTQLYRTQPEVRTVIDFLARNIAQIGLHVFRRISDTDRVRIADHPLALLLKSPNPATARYRLFESTMIDLGIHYNAYWLKMRERNRLQLVRVPPEQIYPVGHLLPTGYRWTWPDGQRWELPPSEIVHFRGYDPDNPLMGLSPLETLRRLLAEERASVEYRGAFWRNAARLAGVILRPQTAPSWTPEKREQFKDDWAAFYSGAANAGKSPVLEDGMSYQPMTATARDSQLVESRKLTREEVAAAYHVPLPMVGILDHATFSNIREQHKQLYQDCLGPWLVMLEEDIELQLLPEFTDSEDVYTEFNISEKLKGSFEEQTASLRVGTGAPFLTRNEARARLNLPRIPEAEFDKPVTNLNTLEGDQQRVTEAEQEAL